jgi:predicted O-methyltransferase YrrM
LPQLASSESLKLRAVGEALGETLAKKMSSEEQELTGLIEQRRAALLNSDREIAVIDYGAGSARSHRTKEEMELGVRSTATVADVCRASKPAFWAILLFKLIRKLQPASCIELGSCVGISAAYQATALSINGKGNLTTIEGAPEVAGIAEETLGILNLENSSVVAGPFHKTLGNVLESSKPIDYLFNDGHHDHDAVLQYLDMALPKLSDEAVIVIDDISWSPGMRKAWAEIENDERIAASVDLRSVGIALLGKRPARQDKYRIPL